MASYGEIARRAGGYVHGRICKCVVTMKLLSEGN